MGKMQSRLEECLANTDTNTYLFAGNSHVTVRHEAWMKTNCLATLALNENIQRLIELLEKSEKKTKSKK